MNKAAPRRQNEWLGHPKGLLVLYFTEMWERLSFYGMKYILVYFLTAAVAQGGWGMAEGNAYLVNGFYGALVYFMCVPAGPLADRYIGKRLAVLWGALFQCIGHFLLGITSAKIGFICGIWFLGMGTGLLKTNISTMVGALYQEGDKRREQGFSLFYQGVNVGAIIAILIPAIKDKWGYHAGFGAAGVGMLLSFIIFLGGWRHTAPDQKKRQEILRGSTAMLSVVLAGLGALALLYIYLPAEAVPQFLDLANKVIAALLTCVLLATCLWLFRRSETQKAKNRLFVICMVFLSVVAYVVVYMQIEGLLSKFVEKQVDRHFSLGGKTLEIGPAYFLVLNPLCIVLLSYPVSLFWQKVEQRVSPLAVTSKLGAGMLIFACSTLVTLFAIKLAEKGNISSSWLVLINVLIVLGELCVMIPGLSFISEIAPASLKSTVMGILWGCISFGQLMGARVSKLAEDSLAAGGNPNVFWLLFILYCAFGLLYMGLNKYTHRLVHSAPRAAKK